MCQNGGRKRVKTNLLKDFSKKADVVMLSFLKNINVNGRSKQEIIHSILYRVMDYCDINIVNKNTRNDSCSSNAYVCVHENSLS